MERRTPRVSGLRTSLISAIVTAIGALVLVLLLLEDPLVQFRLQSLARDELAEVLGRFKGAVDAGESARTVAARIAAEEGVRITVYEEGVPVVDGGLPSPEEEGDEWRTRFETGEGDWFETAERYLYFQRRGSQVIQASRSRSMMGRVRSTVREVILLGGILAGFVAVFLTVVLSRTLVQPTQELTRVADALASGDLSARALEDREDELGQIGRSLGRMSDQLGEQIATLRHEQDRLRTVLNAMVEAVFVADPLGRIQQTNAAFDALVSEEAYGRTAREVLQSDGLHEAVRAARHQQTDRVELDFQRDGKRFFLNAEVAPLPGEEGAVVVLHDVTSLRQADRIRRDFVANASHELRTPLTAIRGFAETLRDGAMNDPEAASRFLDVILRHTKRLDALVSDLAALSKAESPDQRLELENVDVEAAVTEVLRGLTSKADEREVQLIFMPSGEGNGAWASARGLDQVLVNLVDNAIKYTPHGSAVRVSVHAESAETVVEVHNPGPGIPAVHHRRLFERFYRVDEGRSRDVGGTGLGLAIVKHLCSQMGATAGVKSAPGKGATFTVRLRRERPSRNRHTDEGAAESPENTV
ncbi:MAG: ATP-binding protein [Myxococcota bacterium]